MVVRKSTMSSHNNALDTIFPHHPTIFPPLTNSRLISLFYPLNQVLQAQ